MKRVAWMWMTPASTQARARRSLLARTLIGGWAGLVFLGASSTWAAGDPLPEDPPWLRSVRPMIKAQEYDKAIQTLQQANMTKSADWHNLMGYSLRKRTPPDLDAAEGHYKRALEIDSRHRQALEYYGELMLMKGDVAGAEGLLARLDKVCFFGCSEFRDLKGAIAKHKAKAAGGS